ncbi:MULTISPECIES: SRPBCC family protein [unclassified Corallococcus]|uniref:SRPBCC family protein n=1 Tax=unclassified Corallococcus TaxID=2685029 RepID=UPI001A8DEF3C|nr:MULTISPECIES: SRPBCC family protein [unclassified Corallococcus]MBN9687499.1 SRPBCC family protein [Corallococcus sp. NCSPR001]WAS88678.1 SRPBCC family protein [Corallococcus sp. NCRR]
MASKIAIAVLVLVVALGAFIATRPDRFRIERNALVAAPPATVFAQINDLHRFDTWNPFRSEPAPGVTKSFDGPNEGPGASFAYAGGESGDGRMTIMESQPGARVVLKLEFFKPFEATNQATFTLTPENGGTRVSWAMEGENTLMGKAMSLVVNMDTMLGKEFERGLANLDTVARGATPPSSASAQADTAAR